MKENREFNMLENADDKTVELLSGVPVLTKEEKERMLAMSKKKLDRMNREKNISANNDGDEVSGVERYNRPKWHKFATAAACLLLVGGIAGTVFAIGKGSSGGSGKDTLATTAHTDAVGTSGAATAITTTVQPMTVETVQQFTEEELVPVAKSGIENFFYIDEIVSGFGVQVDKNDTFSGHIPNGNIGDTVDYYRVTDSRFNDISDVKALIEAQVTDPLLTNRFASVFECGLAPVVFKEKDGKLYYLYVNDQSERNVTLNGDPIISDFNGTNFKAATSVELAGVTKGVNAQFAYVEGKWKISGFELSDAPGADDVRPNAVLANRLIDDLTVVDKLGAGCGVQVDFNDKKQYSPGEGVDLTYYKVLDDPEATHFKNNIEDIQSYVECVVTGPALENMYSHIYTNRPVSMFRVYEDELYYLYGIAQTNYRFFGEPEIRNEQNGSFDIAVNSFTDDDMVNTFILHVEKVGYSWKINGIELDEASLRAATAEELALRDGAANN
jgi:hypothetical protein